jgi:hypothetical protein
MLYGSLGEFTKGSQRTVGAYMAKRAKAVVGEKKRGAPMKTCPQCKTEVHARKRECPSCGYRFEVKGNVAAKTARKRSPKASANESMDVAAILAIGRLLETHDAETVKGWITQVAKAKEAR